MKKSATLITILSIIFGLFAFKTISENSKHPRDKITNIPEMPQRTNGNAEKGWDYLRYEITLAQVFLTKFSSER